MRAKNTTLFLIPLLGMAPSFASAVDCASVSSDYRRQIDAQKSRRDDPNASEEEKKVSSGIIEDLVRQQTSAELACRDKEREQNKKDAALEKEKAECNAKGASTGGVFRWDGKHCINKAEAKSLPTDDDCSAANVYAGELKGQNCKKAMNTVRDVKARNEALTGATTAATTAYSSLQASGATGAQDDAQTRQANIMKTLAMSKFATGALGLTAAMQLKTAATGAEQGASTITNAQKNIAAACQSAADEQVCFYQNAAKNGISPDQQSYASFERMKRAASQSQDQADAANALAKTSLMAGAADMLVGLQAMRAAQLARNNANQMAPPPVFVPPPPLAPTRFGDGGSAGGTPNMETQAAAPPVDYGNPSDGNGENFGGVNHGPINGSMMGHMGVPNQSKPAASGVSGGSGAGAIGAGGGGGGKGGGQQRPVNRKGGVAVGEYNLAGGGGKGGGGGGGEKADTSNPMAEMLAKLFPQDQTGKTIVDARQIASSGEFANTEGGETQAEAVTATDLSIFEQVSSKYRQLNGSGRF